MVTNRLAVLLALVVLAGLLVGCANLGTLHKLPGPADDLVYVGQDGNVYAVAVTGGQPRLVTRDPAPGNGQTYFYLWPTISPNGRRIVYMRLILANEDIVASGIYVASLDGTDEMPIWQSASDSPVYYAWSPDSKSLGMLVTDGQTVTLLLARSIGQTSARPTVVDNGHELYFAWSPDSRSLLIHSSTADGASSISQVDVSGPNLSTTKLDFVPSEFRSPEWSPSGQYQVISGSPQGGNQDVYLREASTSQLKSLGTFGPNAAFEWSPASDRLAIGSAGPWLSQATYSKLIVVDPRTDQQTTISDTDTLAFFWSPDGKRLAYLEAASSDASPNVVHWVVVDADGKNRHGLESFVPDQAYAELVPYFDQFAQSVSIWSPDSQYLVYTGWLEAMIVGPNERSHVYASRADGSGVARDLADSTFGYWRRVVP